MERIVKLSDIEQKIIHEYYVTGERAFSDEPLDPTSFLHRQRITICTLVLHNGYVVVGTSMCVSLENFDEATGRKYAREDALSKMWPIEGYLLLEKIFQHEHRSRE